jgi:hypothetical protein
MPTIGAAASPSQDLLLRIDARPQLRDDFAIDLDTTFQNQLLTFAATGHACGGEYLL